MKKHAASRKRTLFLELQQMIDNPGGILEGQVHQPRKLTLQQRVGERCTWILSDNERPIDRYDACARVCKMHT